MNRLGVHALVWVGGWSEPESEAAIRQSAELGYDFIEVPLLDPYSLDVERTRKQLEAHGLAATASLGLSPETDISSGDPDALRHGEELLQTALGVARDLGSSHLCGVLYSALQKYMQPASEAGIDGALAVLGRLADRARADGLELGLEVVNRYETNVVNTGAWAVELVRRLDRPNVTVHLDSYHMNIEEGFLGHALENCGPYLGYFHVGESHRGYLGTGTVDFQEIFRALARMDYRGPIAFESFSSAVVDPVLSNMLGVWRNLWSDGHDLARHAKAYMEAELLAAREAVRERPRTGGEARP